tara:strand:- start:177 stop:314 length:138 start_codon:yes stop_codon:yes gene_type:complete
MHQVPRVTFSLLPRLVCGQGIGIDPNHLAQNAQECSYFPEIIFSR